MDTNPEQLTDRDLKTYEIGYLLSPFIPEEGVEEAVGRILKSTIETAGGVVVASPAPRLRKLAYTISIVQGPKKGSYSDAYFGALRFQAEPAVAVSIKETLDKSNEIIRFMVITVPKNAGAMNIKSTTPVQVPGPVGPADVPEVAPEVEKPEMTQAEIDQQIEGLLSPTI